MYWLDNSTFHQSSSSDNSDSITVFPSENPPTEKFPRILRWTTFSVPAMLQPFRTANIRMKQRRIVPVQKGPGFTATKISWSTSEGETNKRLITFAFIRLLNHFLFLFQFDTLHIRRIILILNHLLRYLSLFVKQKPHNQNAYFITVSWDWSPFTITKSQEFYNFSLMLVTVTMSLVFIWVLL